jgi:hypothetical protein
MFATHGPTISADGLQATADLSAPSTINQPQAIAALEAQSKQYESSVASAQQTNPNTLFSEVDRLTALGLATPLAGGPSVASSLAASPTASVSPTPALSPTATPAP